MIAIACSVGRMAFSLELFLRDILADQWSVVEREAIGRMFRKTRESILCILI